MSPYLKKGVENFYINTDCRSTRLHDRVPGSRYLVAGALEEANLDQQEAVVLRGQGSGERTEGGKTQDSGGP